MGGELIRRKVPKPAAEAEKSKKKTRPFGADTQYNPRNEKKCPGKNEAQGTKTRVGVLNPVATGGGGEGGDAEARKRQTKLGNLGGGVLGKCNGNGAPGSRQTVSPPGKRTSSFSGEGRKGLKEDGRGRPRRKSRRVPPGSEGVDITKALFVKGKKKEAKGETLRKSQNQSVEPTLINSFVKEGGKIKKTKQKRRGKMKREAGRSTSKPGLKTGVGARPRGGGKGILSLKERRGKKKKMPETRLPLGVLRV